MEQGDRAKLMHGKGEFYTWLRLNFNAVFFSVVFLTGVFIGSAAFRLLELDKLKLVADMLEGMLAGRQQKTAAECFFSILLPNLLVWGLLLLCGLCAVSAPLIFLTALFRGMGCALTVCAVFSACEEPFYCIFKYLLADYTVGTLALILCCCEALYMSRQLLGAVLISRKKTGEITPTVFFGKMLLMALLMIFGAAVQTYMIGG